ncbi:MAG: protein-export membrane protein SecF [Candidatus Jacksonbacteria bacterium RIFOXYC2_FULL_44_29]|nr:MAG: Protein translocase subunit SecF [Parcubacteria group bacterium GW2011_GWA2_42_28]OGY76676.1 MAG: protein-export membrane protein SecF [Candidatus Jacksonbacteria bacterium RIFOXYA2_FULL_43_12]OGY77586.1 MAG: protein-export membrane protein SecF [Candidatus Jacksonbacteria bacterium RIFOXYB2_FULL_44_15]OGY79708.1 MAG: protein-export membrane protein SecF [Candidatus Jacksonbacteria bacterium RIFOXYD2_FULL_43_21]OGY80563.1 MAG: protein-export membrane protein SecF [Candidatus Jacksonbact
MLKFRKIYYIFSGTLVSLSILAIAFFGLKLGIDFTGGSLMELSITGTTVTPAQIEQILKPDTALNLGDIKIQPLANGLMIRSRSLTEEEHQKVLSLLKEKLAPSAVDQKQNSKIIVTENRFESIGPVIGAELKRNALWEISLVALGIILYISWSFRKVGQTKDKSRMSIKMGVAAVLAVLHDVTITVGVFAVLGKFMNVEIDNSFIAAILLVFGYSVNDTIVVFDRIRENMIRHRLSQNLEQIINQSVRETMVRSLNTSVTIILVLFAILLFGGPSIFYFVLALTIGISIGTYSSIFLASPLLYEWDKKK